MHSFAEKTSFPAQSRMKIKNPRVAWVFALIVARPMQLSNELLEDTRQMAKIWELQTINNHSIFI